MNEQEARLRLSACRTIEEDMHDPFFSEALAQAAHEPALGQWWADQCALDTLLARKLNESVKPGFLPRGLPEAG